MPTPLAVVAGVGELVGQRPEEQGPACRPRRWRRSRPRASPRARRSTPWNRLNVPLLLASAAAASRAPSSARRARRQALSSVSRCSGSPAWRSAVPSLVSRSMRATPSASRSWSCSSSAWRKKATASPGASAARAASPACRAQSRARLVSDTLVACSQWWARAATGIPSWWSASSTSATRRCSAAARVAPRFGLDRVLHERVGEREAARRLGPPRARARPRPRRPGRRGPSASSSPVTVASEGQGELGPRPPRPPRARRRPTEPRRAMRSAEHLADALGHEAAAPAVGHRAGRQGDRSPPGAG